jgi:HK97 family phage major capsid protein
MSAKWAMHDTVLRAVKALVGSDGRPLWQPSVADAVPATIDGDQFIIDQSMSSALTTAQRVMAYGDLSKFQIRDVLGYQLVVLRELYAANRQVGFNMFMRSDSKLLDAGTNPIKYLRLA